jgi:chromosomal replication initiator protein
MNEVLSKNRYRQLVQARYIIAFVLKRDRYLNLSLNNIAFCIGNRDHSTIVHSLKTIENEMDIYEDFRQLMYDIFFYLYGSDIYFPDKYKLRKAV